MKRTAPARMLFAIFVLWVVSAALDLPRTSTTNAATQSTGFKWERETGRQKLTPTTSTGLAIPPNTTAAEFYIEGGDVFYRWDGGTVADTAGTGSAWNASKWPAGHIRKEENDAAKLKGLRLLCSSCTVWVSYSRERRNTDPVP
jgi:hypothetical protein